MNSRQLSCLKQLLRRYHLDAGAAGQGLLQHGASFHHQQDHLSIGLSTCRGVGTKQQALAPVNLLCQHTQHGVAEGQQQQRAGPTAAPGMHLLSGHPCGLAPPSSMFAHHAARIPLRTPSGMAGFHRMAEQAQQHPLPGADSQDTQTYALFTTRYTSSAAGSGDMSAQEALEALPGACSRAAVDPEAGQKLQQLLVALQGLSVEQLSDSCDYTVLVAAIKALRLLDASHHGSALLGKLSSAVAELARMEQLKPAQLSEAVQILGQAGHPALQMLLGEAAWQLQHNTDAFPLGILQGLLQAAAESQQLDTKKQPAHQHTLRVLWQAAGDAILTHQGLLNNTFSSAFLGLYAKAGYCHEPLMQALCDQLSAAGLGSYTIEELGSLVAQCAKLGFRHPQLLQQAAECTATWCSSRQQTKLAGAQVQAIKQLICSFGSLRVHHQDVWEQLCKVALQANLHGRLDSAFRRWEFMELCRAYAAMAAPNPAVAAVFARAALGAIHAPLKPHDQSSLTQAAFDPSAADQQLSAAVLQGDTEQPRLRWLAGISRAITKLYSGSDYTQQLLVPSSMATGGPTVGRRQGVPVRVAAGSLSPDKSAGSQHRKAVMELLEAVQDAVVNHPHRLNIRNATQLLQAVKWVYHSSQHSAAASSMFKPLQQQCLQSMQQGLHELQGQLAVPTPQPSTQPSIDQLQAGEPGKLQQQLQAASTTNRLHGSTALPQGFLENQQRHQKDNTVSNLQPQEQLLLQEPMVQPASSAQAGAQQFQPHDEQQQQPQVHEQLQQPEDMGLLYNMDSPAGLTRALQEVLRLSQAVAGLTALSRPLQLGDDVAHVLESLLHRQYSQEVEEQAALLLLAGGDPVYARVIASAGPNPVAAGPLMTQATRGSSQAPAAQSGRAGHAAVHQKSPQPQAAVEPIKVDIHPDMNDGSIAVTTASPATGQHSSPAGKLNVADQQALQEPWVVNMAMALCDLQPEDSPASKPATLAAHALLDWLGKGRQCLHLDMLSPLHQSCMLAASLRLGAQDHPLVPRLQNLLQQHLETAMTKSYWGPWSPLQLLAPYARVGACIDSGLLSKALQHTLRRSSPRQPSQNVAVLEQLSAFSAIPPSVAARVTRELLPQMQSAANGTRSTRPAGPAPGSGFRRKAIQHAQMDAQQLVSVITSVAVMGHTPSLLQVLQQGYPMLAAGWNQLDTLSVVRLLQALRKADVTPDLLFLQTLTGHLKAFHTERSLHDLSEAVQILAGMRLQHRRAMRTINKYSPTDRLAGMREDPVTSQLLRIVIPRAALTLGYHPYSAPEGIDAARAWQDHVPLNVSPSGHGTSAAHISTPGEQQLEALLSVHGALAALYQVHVTITSHAARSQGIQLGNEPGLGRQAGVGSRTGSENGSGSGTGFESGSGRGVGSGAGVSGMAGSGSGAGANTGQRLPLGGSARLPQHVYFVREDYAKYDRMVELLNSRQPGHPDVGPVLWHWLQALLLSNNLQLQQLLRGQSPAALAPLLIPPASSPTWASTKPVLSDQSSMTAEAAVSSLPSRAAHMPLFSNPSTPHRSQNSTADDIVAAQEAAALNQLQTGFEDLVQQDMYVPVKEWDVMGAAEQLDIPKSLGLLTHTVQLLHCISADAQDAALRQSTSRLAGAAVQQLQMALQDAWQQGTDTSHQSSDIIRALCACLRSPLAPVGPSRFGRRPLPHAAGFLARALEQQADKFSLLNVPTTSLVQLLQALACQPAFAVQQGQLLQKVMTELCARVPTVAVGDSASPTKVENVTAIGQLTSKDSLLASHELQVQATAGLLSTSSLERLSASCSRSSSAMLEAQTTTEKAAECVLADAQALQQQRVNLPASTDWLSVTQALHAAAIVDELGCSPQPLLQATRLSLLQAIAVALSERTGLALQDGQLALSQPKDNVLQSSGCSVQIQDSRPFLRAQEGQQLQQGLLAPEAAIDTVPESANAVSPQVRAGSGASSKAAAPQRLEGGTQKRAAWQQKQPAGQPEGSTRQQVTGTVWRNMLHLRQVAHAMVPRQAWQDMYEQQVVPLAAAQDIEPHQDVFAAAQRANSMIGKLGMPPILAGPQRGDSQQTDGESRGAPATNTHDKVVNASGRVASVHDAAMVSSATASLAAGASTISPPSPATGTQHRPALDYAMQWWQQPAAWVDARMLATLQHHVLSPATLSGRTAGPELAHARAHQQQDAADVRKRRQWQPAEVLAVWRMAWSLGWDQHEQGTTVARYMAQKWSSRTGHTALDHIPMTDLYLSVLVWANMCVQALSTAPTSAPVLSVTGNPSDGKPGVENRQQPSASQLPQQVQEKDQLGSLQVCGLLAHTLVGHVGLIPPADLPQAAAALQQVLQLMPTTAGEQSASGHNTPGKGGHTAGTLLSTMTEAAHLRAAAATLHAVAHMMAVPWNGDSMAVLAGVVASSPTGHAGRPPKWRRQRRDAGIAAATTLLQHSKDPPAIAPVLMGLAYSGAPVALRSLMGYIGTRPQSSKLASQTSQPHVRSHAGQQQAPGHGQQQPSALEDHILKKHGGELQPRCEAVAAQCPSLGRLDLQTAAHLCAAVDMLWQRYEGTTELRHWSQGGRLERSDLPKQKQSHSGNSREDMSVLRQWVSNVVHVQSQHLGNLQGRLDRGSDLGQHAASYHLLLAHVACRLRLALASTYVQTLSNVAKYYEAKHAEQKPFTDQQQALLLQLRLQLNEQALLPLEGGKSTHKEKLKARKAEGGAADAGSLDGSVPSKDCSQYS